MSKINEEIIKDVIQEWFESCYTATEAALLYGKIFHELQCIVEEFMNTLQTEE